MVLWYPWASLLAALGPAGTPLVHGGPTLHTLVGAAGAVRPVEVKPAWARGPSARVRVRSKLLGLAGVRGEQVQGVASHLLHSFAARKLSHELPCVVQLCWTPVLLLAVGV